MSEPTPRPSFDCLLEKYRQNPVAYWRKRVSMGCIACADGTNAPQVSIEPPYISSQPTTIINNPEFIGTTCPAGEPIPGAQSSAPSTRSARSAAAAINKAVGILGAVTFVGAEALAEPLHTPTRAIGFAIAAGSFVMWAFDRYANTNRRT